MTTQTLKASQIEISKENPRKNFDDATIEGLAQSIKTEGLLQNLVVAKPKGKKKKHPIICGERRFRALTLLIERGEFPKDYEILVEIKEGLSNEQILRMATMENMQREDLTPLEEAEAITMLIQDGKKLDDILAQTGLSESTIKRRLILMNLSSAIKQALAEGEVTLSKAEVLSMASHEEQDGLLEMATDEYYDAEYLKDRILCELPTLSMAIFDKEDYTGRYTHDLLAEDDATYFDDVEQFFELQKIAAERLVEQHLKTAEWAELHEGYFRSWEYGETQEGETGGVVVALDSSGKVEVHEGLLKTKADKATTEKLKAPRSTYARPLVENMGMHKSVAVMAALLENPRKAKELAVASKISYFMNDVHDSLYYFAKEGNGNPPALELINDKAKEILILFDAVQEDDTWHELAKRFSDEEDAYEYVKGFSDDDLERVLVTFTALSFGQTSCDRLDTGEGSIFNQIALDLDVDMKNYWRPDEPFLKRRNKVQLQQIITEAGCSIKFGNAAGHKKKDLVTAMAKHFQHVLTLEAPTEDDLKATYWLPEAMQFPAIDPDAKKPEPVEEEAEETEEELAQAA